MNETEQFERLFVIFNPSDWIFLLLKRLRRCWMSCAFAGQLIWRSLPWWGAEFCLQQKEKEVVSDKHHTSKNSKFIIFGICINLCRFYVKSKNSNFREFFEEIFEVFLKKLKKVLKKRIVLVSVVSETYSLAVNFFTTSQNTICGEDTYWLFSPD